MATKKLTTLKRVREAVPAAAPAPVPASQKPQDGLSTIPDQG